MVVHADVAQQSMLAPGIAVDVSISANDLYASKVLAVQVHTCTLHTCTQVFNNTNSMVCRLVSVVHHQLHCSPYAGPVLTHY